MDSVYTDLSIDVPDTPDRVATHGAHGRARADYENHSTPLSYRLQDVSNEGRSRGRAPGPSKDFGNSNLPTASSSRNAHVMRKGITEKNPTYRTDNFVDLTERNMRRPGGLANVTSYRTSFRTAREEMDSVSELGPGNDFRAGNTIQERTGNGITLPHDPVASPRVNRQKRLVRNGCISPNNVSKAKQLSGKNSDSSAAFECNNNDNGSNAYSAPPVSIDITELVAEASDSYPRKGKGVLTHPCDSKNENSQSRRSINFNEKTIAPSDYSKDAGKSIENLGGWRSTRNQNRGIIMSSHDEDLHVIRGKSPLRYSSQPHESRFGRRETGASSVSDGDYVNPQSLKESVAYQRTRLGRLNGARSTASTLNKRQKLGSTSSTHGQCSTSVSDDQEVVLLDSPAETAYSRSTSRIVDNLNQTMVIDEISPQLRRNARDEEIRARQLEADELLARELQEQFYNEAPAFEVGEVDENIALALQHQDGLDNEFDQARHPVLNERASISSLPRQPLTRASSRAPRRGSLARTTTPRRRTRQLCRFPGQARTLLPSRGRTSTENMNVDMRMNTQGALEEFHDMGLPINLIQAVRGLIANDYETLSALDNDNDRHTGTPSRVIHGLPQSTVQSESFDETCAVCLDTPTIGDTIRHLPCLHKFHKDCIDPWLRRKTSCPICKSSVT